MKIWSVLVLGLAGLNESQAYRSSWSSWSSWSSNPNGVRSQKYRNEFKSDMQNKVREMKLQNDAPSDTSKAKNVKCHTSCTNGNCETKCTKNGKEVSSNEANYQFNYITQPKKSPAKMQHSRKRVQQAPVSTSYSSCTFTCKSGKPCVKTCKGPNAENINMDIKRSGNMKQNVHFDFKVKHQQKNPIANVGNGHGCSYPRVIVGSSCRMPAEQKNRKNMCVKVKTNGRSKTMSITGLISKPDCCCGSDDGTKWGAKKCPQSGSASEENVCSGGKAQTGRGNSRRKPEEINEVVATTESSVGGCAPTTEGYPSSCSGNDSGCPNNECGAENNTQPPPPPPSANQQREATEEPEEDSGCSSCDGSCAPEEYNNPTTPGCSGCDSCSNSTPTPAPQRQEPATTTEEAEPGCGECDGSCPDSAEEQATTPGCSGCGGREGCGDATTEPYIELTREPTREPEVTTEDGCGGGCDGGCDNGGCDGGCGGATTPSDGGCDSCDSCGGTEEPYTQEPETVETTTVEPTAVPTTPTREREPETTVPETVERTEEDPEEIPDYSGAYGDENQNYPKPQIQVEELEREASSSCGRGDTNCDLPAAVYNQGADQNECFGENCGEPLDVSADCLDCHVENKDIPGGSENAQFLQDLGCRGSNCDLASAYLENTTGEILMSTGGIPGTAAPTGPRTKTPRPSPAPTSPYESDTTAGQFGMLPTDDFLYEPVRTLERVNNYPDDQELSAIGRQAPAQRPNRAEAAERETEVVSKTYEVFEMPLNEEGVCEQSNSFGEVFITSANSVTKEECCCAAYLNNRGLLDQSEAKSVNRAFNAVDCPLPKSAGYRKLCPAKMGVAKYSYENQPRKLRDINECDLFEACGVSGICQNFKKSYSCDCFKNYKFNPVSMKCEQSVQIKSCFVGRIDDNRQRIKVNNFMMPGFEHVSSRNMNTCGRNLGRHSKEDCCCGPAFDDLFNMPGSVDPNKGGNGKYSWGSNCKACPNRGTSAYRRLCM